MVICSTVAVFAVNANVAVWSNVDIGEVYAYGDTFEVPERTLTVGSTVVKALHTVSFPGGSSVRGKSVKLTETGNYTVRYYANVGKNQYSAEKDLPFRVLHIERAATKVRSCTANIPNTAPIPPDLS